MFTTAVLPLATDPLCHMCAETLSSILVTIPTNMRKLQDEEMNPFIVSITAVCNFCKALCWCLKENRHLLSSYESMKNVSYSPSGTKVLPSFGIRQSITYL